MQHVMEERLREVARLVTEAERRAARQRQIIADLRKDGLPTGDAMALLGPIEDLLERQREQRHRLQAALGEFG